MEQKEIIKKAIARLTDEEKFNYFKYLVESGYKTFEDVIEFATECYAFEENLSIEKVYNDCKEIADTYYNLKQYNNATTRI